MFADIAATADNAAISIPIDRYTAQLIGFDNPYQVVTWDIETPALIRYGQLTNDEFFISESAAKEGVQIMNHSTTDPIVILKHFGPRNPDLVVK